MLIHGWGGYPAVEAEVLRPTSLRACPPLVGKKRLIPRGNGRSYGDSANAARVLQTDCLDRFISFDANTGLLEVESGVLLQDVLALLVPRGWFLSVTPGTSFVTVGGAIASDVHGKNHHCAGTFGEFTRSMKILLGTGEVVTASRDQNTDLFRATCGGMGLTGVILSAVIQLQPVRSSNMRVTTIKTGSLAETLALFEQHAGSTYSVAWIDCLALGRRSGRSLLSLGEHAEDGNLGIRFRQLASVPMYAPSVCVNRATMTVFNSFYYAIGRNREHSTVPASSYFYPLDAVMNWNRLYGRKGFVQYQFVLPKDSGLENMSLLLQKIAKSGLGSSLAVLKQFGPQNDFLMSFPMEGYTLALDFKYGERAASVLRELNGLLLEMGGRIYLTKDALMTEEIFKQSYPGWEAFEAVREKYGAIGQFASDQSLRLGLR